MSNPELIETLKNLLLACNELMTEFVSKKRAADWGLINDAMVEGQKAIAELRRGNVKV